MSPEIRVGFITFRRWMLAGTADDFEIFGFSSALKNNKFFVTQLFVVVFIKNAFHEKLMKIDKISIPVLVSTGNNFSENHLFLPLYADFYKIMMFSVRDHSTIMTFSPGSRNMN
jgi:hypothetical protein